MGLRLRLRIWIDDRCLMRRCGIDMVQRISSLNSILSCRTGSDLCRKLRLRCNVTLWRLVGVSPVSLLFSRMNCSMLKLFCAIFDNALRSKSSSRYPISRSASVCVWMPRKAVWCVDSIQLPNIRTRFAAQCSYLQSAMRRYRHGTRNFSSLLTIIC